MREYIATRGIAPGGLFPEGPKGIFGEDDRSALCVACTDGSSPGPRFLNTGALIIVVLFHVEWENFLSPPPPQGGRRMWAPTQNGRDPLLLAGSLCQGINSWTSITLPFLRPFLKEFPIIRYEALIKGLSIRGKLKIIKAGKSLESLTSA